MAQNRRASHEGGSPTGNFMLAVSSTSSAPPAQQTAMQSSTQVSGIDMSALLQGISPEQLAVIGHLFQTGQLQLPPQPPTALVPPQIQGTAPENGDISNKSVVQNAATNGVAEGKEDEELDEGVIDTSGRRDFLHPPPTGPRKRSPIAYDRRRRYSEDKIQKSRKARMSPVSSARLSAQRQAKRAAAKSFILAVHEAGFAFEDLATELDDARFLSVLYHELGLSVAPPRNSESSKPIIALTGNPADKSLRMEAPDAIKFTSNTRAAEVVPPTSDQATATASQTSSPKTTAAKKLVPAKTPVDRSAYLARLQAARAKAAAPTTQSKTPDVSAVQHESTTAGGGTVTQKQQISNAPLPPSSLATSLEQRPATSPKTAADSQPKKAKLQTDLVRQRLAALKEAQARRNGADQVTAAAGQVSMGNGSAMYNAVAQAVQTAAPGLSAQHVRDAVAVIASQPAISTTPPPVMAVQSASDTAEQPGSQQASTVPQLAHLNAMPSHSPSGPQFPGLPGLFMSGSPFEKRSGMSLPGLPLSSVSTEQTQATARAPAPPLPTSTSAQHRSAAPSTYDSDSSSHLNSIFSPPEPGNSVTVRAITAGLKRGMSDVEEYPRKRAFGQKVIDHVVIDNSDEESEGGDESEFDDDIEMDDTTASGADAANNTTQQAPSSARTNVPTRPASVLPSPNGYSGSSTPGALTPGGSAYHRKLLEIQELNRQIELRAQKAKARGSNTPLQNGSIAEVPMITPAHNGASNADSTSVATPPKLASNQPQEASAGSPDSSTTDEMDVSSEEEGEVEEMPAPEQSVEASTLEVGDEGGEQANETKILEQDGDSPNDFDDGEIDEATVPNQDAHVTIPQRDVESSDTSSIDYDTTSVARPPMQRSNAAESSTSELDVYVQPGPQSAGPKGHDNPDPHDDHSESDSSDDEQDGEEDSEDEYDPAEAFAEDTHAGDALPTEPATAPGASLSSDELSRPLIAISNGDLDTSQVDGLAPELQPSVSNEKGDNKEEGDDIPASRFTPYETPLARFKDFRYHPEYTAYVPGGYRSLTYSNKIDPHAPFCEAEINGKDCTQADCSMQHFRDVAFSDNDLLRELGTNHIPESPEENARWKQGLGEVVKQLRSTNLGKDVNAIAARIAQFRREFSDSPDKVLNLGL